MTGISCSVDARRGIDQSVRRNIIVSHGVLRLLFGSVPVGQQDDDETARAIVSTIPDRISRTRVNAARAPAGSSRDTVRPTPGFGPAHGFSATGAVVVFVAPSASSKARRIAAAAFASR